MNSPMLKELSNIIYLDDLTLAFSGNFSDSMTDKIIGMAEAYLESHQELSVLRKKTSFLVAECFQNVVRHGTKNPEKSMFSVGNESFLIRFYGNKCFIASENTLPNDQVESLRKKLDEVNQYNKEELKALYKISLAGGGLSEKGGAGLGLIEMARKTGNKLHYSFMKLDEEKSTFHLLLVLEPVDNPFFNKDYTEELRQIEGIINTLCCTRQFLLYHGDFSQEIILPVIEMIENNLDAEKGPLAPKIKFYHAAVESMQIISHLSLIEKSRNVGTLALGKANGGYVVSTMNPVYKESGEDLGNFLNELKNTPPEESESKFKSRVIAGTKPEGDAVVSGFVDMSRIGTSWDYSIDKGEEDVVHLSYQVYI